MGKEEGGLRNRASHALAFSFTRNGNAQLDAGRVANAMQRQRHHVMTPKDVFRVAAALHRRDFASVETKE